MIRWFTVMAIVWWFLAGCIHALSELYGGRNQVWDAFVGSEEVNMTLIQVNWPRPSRLFKVASLNCDEANMWVSTRSMAYSLETAQSMENRRTLTQMSNESVGAMICGPQGCDALSRSLENS